MFGILFHPAIAGRAATALPTPRMTYLDNGNVRIGMDLALGGAVTFISGKDHPGNLINSADLGRQIQMSHYSGPWPYEVGDKKPHPAWVGLGWNPIQTGDCHLNPARAKRVAADGPLKSFAGSSWPAYLFARSKRPAWLRVDRLLGEWGMPEDSPAGRQRL